MKIRAFITHKQSEHFADCQDRFAVGCDTKSIAVSDGMGSTWQQKIWAELLVERFTKENDCWEPSVGTIKPLCREWRANVETLIQQLKNENAPINIIYRNEKCLNECRSAGATFVGIRFSGNQWNGVVLGDSCLIEWDGSCATFYTSQSTDTFDSYPDYFDSDEYKLGKGVPRSIHGELTDKNLLLLVSDPFSNFLLQKYKEGTMAEYIRNIIAVETHEYFENLVLNWRSEGMPNDDSTLIIVEYDKEDEFSVVQRDDIDSFIVREKNQAASEGIQEKTIEIECKSNPIDLNSNVKQSIKDLFFGCLTTKDKRVKGLKNRLMRIVEKGIDKLFELYTITKK